MEDHPLAQTNDELRTARGLSRALDTALRIPGTRIRFGLDPILGLVPGLGDVAGAVFSGYVILLAARRGAPAPVLLRMAANVGIDTIFGAIPLIGSVFDVAWKANRRNVALLEGFLEQPAAARRSSTAMIAAGLAALVLLTAGAIAIAVYSVVLLLRALG